MSDASNRQTKTALMEFPLHSSARKAIVAGSAALLASVYLALVACQFLASHYGRRQDIASLIKASRLDPRNADYPDQIGRYQELVARDPSAAVVSYVRAAQLNPHSARYWFDLARVYQILGETSQQSASLERAIGADPTTPDVAWEAANFYLAQGQSQRALREFRVVLANDPGLAGAAVQFCWRIQPDIDALLRDVIPPTTDAYTALLSLLIDKRETQQTEKVWDAMVRSQQPFGVRTGLTYFRYLILQKDVDEAQRVWRDTARRFSLNAYLPTAANLIVNGNFGLDVLNGGFDWQYQKQSGVELMLDPSEFHGGRRSLLITFDGPGISDAGITQMVPVQPDTSYEFSAYYKIGGMEGAGAPHFTLQDGYHQTIYYDSDELKEAGYWKSVIGEFTTGPDCRLLILHVRRLPAGSPIRGKLWIDDFRLTAKRVQQ